MNNFRNNGVEDESQYCNARTMGECCGIARAGLATSFREGRIAQNCDNDRNEGGGALQGTQRDPQPGYCAGGSSRVSRLSVATEPDRLKAVNV